MEHTVLAYLRKQQAEGKHLTAAVSGGADSMALLTVLLHLQKELPFTLCAAHFNHGLRGEEAERDEAFVRDYCKANSIPLTVGHGDCRQRARDTGESLEEAARNLRYAFFDKLDTDFILTAHTANDNAETLLLHLLRGTGPRGLCGIPARRGRILRPLLTVSRKRIEQYLNEKGISHIEDSTNAENDCVRNRIRHEVMPLLLRENPQFLSAVSRTAQLQTAEDAYLSALAAQAMENCRAKDGFSCKKLRQLPQVLLHRVLLAALQEQQTENPALPFVEALEKLIFTDNPSAKISLPDGLCAARVYDTLTFTPSDIPTFAPVELPVGGSVTIKELGLTVSCTVTENSEICHKKEETLFLRCDRITQTLLLRPRRTGDTLCLPGGTKTMKKLMIDRKIPARERSRIPVIECDGKVAAVFGLGVSRDFLPQAGVPVLKIATEGGSLHAEPTP